MGPIPLIQLRCALFGRSFAADRAVVTSSIRRVKASAFLAIPALAAAVWTTPAHAQPLDACGPVKQVQQCDAERHCDRVPAYDVPDYWHGLAQCMRGLREVWSRKGADAPVDMPNGQRSASGVAGQVRLQVVREMSSSHVRFLGPGDPVSRGFSFDAAFGPKGESKRTFDRVLLVNDKGLPYNAMGQSGLAYFLYQMAALAGRGTSEQSTADARMYRLLARGAIRTVITPVSQGGLATTRSCGARRCTWYHSVTRRDQTTEMGATLNQDLHAIRDLGLIADTVAKLQWDEGIDFEKAITEGLNQLAFSAGSDGTGAPPNLQDFLAPPVGEAGVRWAYYGFNPMSMKQPRGYFLGKAGKDCNYHLHVLDLLSQILERQQAKGGLDRYRDELLSCDRPIAEFQRAARLRKTQPTLPASWSAPSPGRDFSCPRLVAKAKAEVADSDEDESPSSSSFLDKQLQSCKDRRR